MNPPIDWLLDGPPWVRYRTRLDLLDLPETDPAVAADRAAMLAHPLVSGLVRVLAAWPGQVLSSHKSASQAYHRLTFLADLGLRANDPGMSAILDLVLAHQSDQGAFTLPMRIPEAYGGTGREQSAWALCDAPVTLYALIRLGMGNDVRVQRAVRHLAGLARPNGFPCAVSPALGSWRGPGRKDDPCPYATLVAVKALALTPGEPESAAVRQGAACLLHLWEQSRQRHPYMFYMGSDFRKLKAPFVWYDLFHVLDVLAPLTWLHGDPRLEEMLDTLAAACPGSGAHAGGMDTDGRFTAGSIWKAWDGWDFGQKKEPSPWITLLAWRVLRRAGRSPG